MEEPFCATQPRHFYAQPHCSRADSRRQRKSHFERCGRAAERRQRYTIARSLRASIQQRKVRLSSFVKIEELLTQQGKFIHAGRSS